MAKKSRYPAALGSPMIVAANPRGWHNAMRTIDMVADYPHPRRVTLLEDGTIHLLWYRRERAVEAKLTARGDLYVRAQCNESERDVNFPEHGDNIFLTLKRMLDWLLHRPKTQEQL